MAKPRQNRVDPFGELISDRARGAFMGNRGCLHDPTGKIVRHHQGKRWIYCLLEFKDRKRDLMVPGRYTELFFLDEATAFAAGHRPCFECQRDRFREFAEAWVAGNPHRTDDDTIGATELDEQLHDDRLIGRAGKRSFRARLAELPDGTMVVSPGSKEIGASLIWQGGLKAWSPSGYGRKIKADPGTLLEVLTPPSTVRAFERFVPIVGAAKTR